MTEGVAHTESALTYSQPWEGRVGWTVAEGTGLVGRPLRRGDGRPRGWKVRGLRGCQIGSSSVGEGDCSC
jgi:hypothetical protein